MTGADLSPLDVLLVGAGNAGSRHGAAVQRVPGLRPSGVVDADRGAAERLAAALGCPAHEDLAAGLSACRRGLAIAVICTPPSTHGALALAALRRGVHVLIEKPLDTDLRMIGRVERAAREAGCAAGAVAQHRFAEDVARLQRMLVSGRVGRPTAARVRVQRTRDLGAGAAAGGWRRRPEAAGGGVLLTVGFHYLDLLCWMLGGGAGSDVVATAEGERGMESALRGSFTWGGIHCEIDARWGAVAEREDELALALPDGEIVLRGDRLVGGGAAAGAPDRRTLYERQLSDLQQAIRARRPPAVTPSDVAPALALIQRLYEAAEVAR